MRCRLLITVGIEVAFGQGIGRNPNAEALAAKLRLEFVNRYGKKSVKRGPRLSGPLAGR